MQKPAVPIALVALLASALWSSACVLPTPPPPMSHAKFVHPPNDRGRLGFSTGIGLHLESSEDMSILAFPSEAGMGWSLADRYDLGLSVGNMLGSLEGNVTMLKGRRGLRLGLLHGFGTGLFASSSEASLLLHSSGGLMLQTSRRSPFYIAGKYTYATSVGSGETFQPTHYITSNVGFVPPGRLKVVPELAVSHARWTNPSPVEGDASELRTTTIIIGVTMLTGF